MNQTKTLALLALLSALLIAVSYWIIGGWGGAVFGAVLAAVTNLGSWYYSDKIALSAYRAQPVSEEQAPSLHKIVRRLSDRAGLPMPDVYLVPTQAANAFATGRDPEHAAVAVTEGLLNLLPEEEIEGVLAHELSHVSNRDTLTQAVTATIAGAISFLAHTASYSLWAFGGSRNDQRGPNPLGLIFAVVLAPIAATVIQMGISRTREFAADAGAAQLTKNPRALASALQRLESSAQKFSMPGNPAFEPLLITNNFTRDFMSSLFSTHPSTEARVEKLLELEKVLSDQPSSLAG